MKHVVLNITAIILSFFASAQTIGYIGKDTINNYFLSKIQFVYPEFSFSADSAEFVSKLNKSFLFPKAYANQARILNLDEDSLNTSYIRDLQKLIEDKYLATLYLDYLFNVDISISEKGVSDYYNQNIYQFVEPGVYSYIWAIIADSSENNLKFVNEKIKELVKSEKNSEKLKKEVTDKYAILIEFDQTVRPNHFLYSRLRNSNKGDIVGPFYENGQFVMLAVLDVKPEKITPFSQVEEFCRQKMIDQKRLNLLDSIQKSVVIENPIYLDNNYFSQ